MGRAPVLGFWIAPAAGECVAPLELGIRAMRHPGFAPGAIIRACAGGGIQGCRPTPLLKRRRPTLQIAVLAALSAGTQAAGFAKRPQGDQPREPSAENSYSSTFGRGLFGGAMRVTVFCMPWSSTGPTEVISQLLTFLFKTRVAVV